MAALLSEKLLRAKKAAVNARLGKDKVAEEEVVVDEEVEEECVRKESLGQTL